MKPKKVLPLLIGNIFIGLCLMVMNPLAAQTIEPDLTNTAGFNAIMDGTSVSSSLGEPATTTLTGIRSIITQGYLQPELFTPCNSIQFLVYPNPFIDVITIEVENCDQPLHSVVVHDLNGREMVKKPLLGNQINLGILPVGIYLVQGLTENGTQLGSFKINRTKSP